VSNRAKDSELLVSKLAKALKGKQPRIALSFNQWAYGMQVLARLREQALASDPAAQALAAADHMRYLFTMTRLAAATPGWFAFADKLDVSRRQQSSSLSLGFDPGYDESNFFSMISAAESAWKSALLAKASAKEAEQSAAPGSSSSSSSSASPASGHGRGAGGRDSGRERRCGLFKGRGCTYLGTCKMEHYCSRCGKVWEKTYATCPVHSAKSGAGPTQPNSGKSSS